jgi:xanthine permease XanP
LTSSVGLSGATGVTSRRIAYVIGGMFLVLAFLPKAAALLAVVPRPVLGATLVFSACFILINGFQIVTSRMLDARRTFVIGLSFTIGLAVDVYPSSFAALPAVIKPFAGSFLVLGTVSALVLNAVFRLGVRRAQTLVVDPADLDPKKIADFMEAQGATWGARRDVVDRASFNLTQSIEVIVDSCEPQGPLVIEASFDEFSLDIRVSYAGAPIELPEKRPTNEEIMASEQGQRRLAGFMLRRHADRVGATHRAGRSTILFHFDH